MSDDEMITKLRAMAQQCIDAPKSKEFFDAVANRLQELKQQELEAEEQRKG